MGILDLQRITGILIPDCRGGGRFNRAYAEIDCKHSNCTLHYECFRYKRQSFPHKMNFEDELPDIPYTPMRDRNIDEGAASSSATDPPDPKRARPMTGVERKARSRAAQSAKKRGEARCKNRNDKATHRLEESAEERETSQTIDRNRKAVQRSDQSTDQRETAKAKNRNQKAVQRSEQSTDQRETAQAKNRNQKARTRQQARTKVDRKEAMNSQEILDGTHTVLDLKDTEDDIGKMNVVCVHC